MKNGFEGFVLAGGKSSRMGADKAFLKIRNETFLECAVKNLQLVCNKKVSAVLNRNQTHYAAKLPPNVSHIFDIFENRGALGGIHTALKNCQSEFAVILAVDMPLISGEIILRLVRTILSSANPAAIVPLQPDKRPQPLCAVYRVNDCLPKVEELLNTTASASVKDFLNSINVKFIEPKNLLEGKAESFSNINTPSEYKDIIEIL